MRSDYISREAALSALFNGEHNIYSWDEIEEILSAVPAADVVERELYQMALSDVVRLSVERPERKHGKWIEQYQGHNLLKCSACGYEYSDYIECQNFCGNCGADMRQKDGAE